MKNKAKILKILNDMARELSGLAGGGVVGIKNCRHITLLSTDIQLVSEYLAQEADDIPAEDAETVKEETDDTEHSDDNC